MDALRHGMFAARAASKKICENPVDKSEIKLLESSILELQNKIRSIEKHLIVMEAKGQLPNYNTVIGKIALIVCNEYEVDMEDVRSYSKIKSLVMPRHTAFYLCKKNTKKSLPEIANWFNRKDHSTVFHAVRKIEANRLLDQDLNCKLLRMQALITPIVTRPIISSNIPVVVDPPGPVVEAPRLPAQTEVENGPR